MHHVVRPVEESGEPGQAGLVEDRELIAEVVQADAEDRKLLEEGEGRRVQRAALGGRAAIVGGEPLPDQRTGIEGRDAADDCQKTEDDQTRPGEQTVPINQQDQERGGDREGEPGCARQGQDHPDQCRRGARCTDEAEDQRAAGEGQRQGEGPDELVIIAQDVRVDLQATGAALRREVDVLLDDLFLAQHREAEFRARDVLQPRHRGLDEAEGADRQRQGPDVGFRQVRDRDRDQEQADEAPRVEPEIGRVGGVGERQQASDQEADLRQDQGAVEPQAGRILPEARELGGDQRHGHEKGDAHRQAGPAADARQVLPDGLEMLEEAHVELDRQPDREGHEEDRRQAIEPPDDQGADAAECRRQPDDGELQGRRAQCDRASRRREPDSRDGQGPQRASVRRAHPSHR